MEYVDRKEDPLIQVVRTHQHNTDSGVLQTARCLKTEVHRETRKMQDSIAEKTKERWHGKRMHGQLPRNLDEKLADIEQSYRWLKSGDIKGETKPVYEKGDVTVLWNQAVHTDREVTANKPDIIIKNQKRKHAHR
jgi:hypothetical protein